MKLLIVGSNGNYAIERFYFKHLSRDVQISKIDLFPAQQMFLKFYQKSFFNKVSYRLGLSNILNKINKELKLFIELNTPDAVLVFKGMEIYPDTLKWMHEKGIKLINYNTDSPFIFTGRGSGNKNITRSIGLYDLFISYDQQICDKMQQQYKVRSACLPFGFEEIANAPNTHQSELMKVCFVGNYDKHRHHFLNTLAERGLEIDLYGMNWNKKSFHHNISFCGPLFGNDLIQCYQKYRVQLNLMRIHNPESHNMRTFEIAGYGGIQLAPLTHDHQFFFEEGTEIFLFKGIEDCLNLANQLLSLSQAEADVIRKKVQQRCIDNRYSYQHRATQLVQFIHQVVHQ